MRAKILEVDFTTDTAVIKLEGDYFFTNSEYVILEKKDFEKKDIEQIKHQAEILHNENSELKDRIRHLTDANKKLHSEIELKRPKITKNYE